MYAILISPKIQIVLAPHSTQDIPLQFMPSALGQASHTTKITFKCEQVNLYIIYGTTLLIHLTFVSCLLPSN